MGSTVECSLLGFLEPLPKSSVVTTSEKAITRGACFLNLLLSLLLSRDVPRDAEGSVFANGSSSGGRDTESEEEMVSGSSAGLENTTLSTGRKEQRREVGQSPQGLSEASFQESKDLVQHLLSPVLVTFTELRGEFLPCGGEGSNDVAFGVGEAPDLGKIIENYFPELHQLLQGQIVSWLQNRVATEAQVSEKTFETSGVGVAEDFTSRIAASPVASGPRAEIFTFLFQQTGEETANVGNSDCSLAAPMPENNSTSRRSLIGHCDDQKETLVNLRPPQEGSSQSFPAKEVLAYKKLEEMGVKQDENDSAETQIRHRFPADSDRVLEYRKPEEVLTESFPRHHEGIQVMRQEGVGEGDVQEIQLSSSEDGIGKVLAAEIFKEVVARVKLHQGDGTSKMVLKLKPEFLGKLEVLVTVEKGVLHTKFIVENPAVAHLIENHLPELQHSLQAHRGACWQQVNVDVDCQGNSQGFSQSFADQEDASSLLQHFRYPETRAFSPDGAVGEKASFLEEGLGVVNYLV